MHEREDGEGRNQTNHTTGFWYVTDASLDADVGQVICNPSRRPPWLVVDHNVHSVGVSSWPGRLLQVAMIDKATDADGAGGLVANAGHTRCVAIEVQAVLNPAMLFGDHGAAVVDVVHRAQQLSRDDAVRMGAAIHPSADDDYSAAWNEWLNREQRADSPHFGNEHSNVLLIPERGRIGSPVGSGFLLVSGELRKRAVAIDDHAEMVDEDGEAELVPLWSAARSALLHAMMALGAPMLSSDDARHRLLQGWQAVNR